MLTLVTNGVTSRKETSAKGRGKREGFREKRGAKLIGQIFSRHKSALLQRHCFWRAEAHGECLYSKNMKQKATGKKQKSKRVSILLLETKCRDLDFLSGLVINLQHTICALSFPQVFSYSLHGAQQHDALTIGSRSRCPCQAVSIP